MKAVFRFFYLHKKRSATVAVLWTLLILGACLMPGHDVPEVSVPFADKWTHFIIFGIFSFLWLCAFRSATTKTGWLVFFLALALGYAVELLQGSGITQGRSYDLYDVLADALGGLLGVLLFFALRKRAEATT